MQSVSLNNPSKRVQKSPVMLIVAATVTVALTPVTGSFADSQNRPAKQMQVKVTDDFEVTGDGSNAAWRKAKWVPLSKREHGSHDYTARFKLLYSKTGLYTLLEGSDSRLTTTFDKDFQNLYSEDVFEIFLWTDERFPIYFEYEISPLGYELPIIIPNLDGKLYGWRPWHYEGNRRTRRATTAIGGPKKSGARVKGWRAEVFIPFELLTPMRNVPPQSGSQWRANFYRIDYDDGKTTQWDWTRVGLSFHEYQKFGTIVFE